MGRVGFEAVVGCGIDTCFGGKAKLSKVLLEKMGLALGNLGPIGHNSAFSKQMVLGSGLKKLGLIADVS